MATDADRTATEARRRFDDAFDQLAQRSKTAAEARSARDLDEISAEHVKLDELRREAWAAKKAIASRREPSTPDHVVSPTGVVDTSRRGRVFAVIGALLVAAVVPVLWFAFERAQFSVDVSVDSQRIIEVDTNDGRRRCLLEVELATRNSEPLVFEVTRASMVIDQRRVGSTIEGNGDVGVGADRLVVQTLVAPVTSRPCPGLDQVDRGTLTLDLRGDSSDGMIEIRRTVKP